MAGASTHDDDKVEKRRLQLEKAWETWSWPGLLADTIGGLVCWSMMLHVVVDGFFYPCVKMAFTGWEVFLLAFGSPALLVSPTLRRWTVTHYWAFRLFALTGILSYWLDQENHGVRIGVGGMGVIIDLLGTMGLWSAAPDGRRERGVTGFFAGLLLTLVFRLIGISMNPIYENPQVNLTIVGVGVLAALILYFETVIPDIPKPSPTAPKWYRALGMTGLLFLTHYLFTYTGVISRWVELPPFPHGILVFLALVFGHLLSVSGVAESFLWFLITGVGGALLFSGSQNALPPWVEFSGGLLLAVYCGSVYLSTARQTARSVSMKGFVAGAAAYFVLMCWSIYVVAYKFVEGGWLLRERSVSLTVTVVLLTGLGHVTELWPSAKVKNRIHFRGVLLLGFIVVGLLTPASVWRLQKSWEPPLNPNPTEIKTLVWAIHFGYNNFGGSNVKDLTETMKEHKVNVVETDATRVVMENRDLVEYMAEELHFYSDYGSSTSQNTWGCALLSQFPIESSERIILPSPQGELACLIDAYLRVNDTIVNVIVTHFGNTDDELDRELQTESVANLISKKRETNQPYILIGYLTADPYSDNWRRIVTSGLRDTIDSYDRYCLYTLYNNLNFKTFYRIDKGDMSDTEAQVATFQLKGKETKSQLPCQTYQNDPVGCQATDHCGWCETKTQGACHDAVFMDACQSFGAVWVGPKNVPTGVPRGSLEEERKSFVENQLLQLSQGNFPVTITGKKVKWNVHRFQEFYRLFGSIYSPIFEMNGHYWQLRLYLPKRGSLSMRPLGVFLVSADEPKDTKVKASLTAVNLKNPSGSITKRVEGPVGRTGLGTSVLVTFGDLFQGFLAGGSLAFEVQFE